MASTFSTALTMAKSKLPTITPQYKFKNSYNLEQRKLESSRVMEKYADRIPIICEKTSYSKLAPIDKNKYLVPKDLSIGQFMYVIRKRLKLPATQTIYFTVNGFMPSTSVFLSDLYQKYKDEDGFIYIQYCDENVFGQER